MATVSCGTGQATENPEIIIVRQNFKGFTSFSRHVITFEDSLSSAELGYKPRDRCSARHGEGVTR